MIGSVLFFVGSMIDDALLPQLLSSRESVRQGALKYSALVPWGVALVSFGSRERQVG